MELTPSQVGARAEKAVAIALARAGYDVLLPAFGAHFRYDLVVDDGGRLLRVQCKTSRVRDEVVVFLTCSNTGNRPKDYRGEVDYFGVHSHELGEVYLVPVDDVPFRAAHLRLKPARNGQTRGIRWARDYRVTPQVGT